MRLRRLVLGLLSAFLAIAPAVPCTTFVLQDGARLLFGRNLDWNWADGLAIVNPRGVAKTALLSPEQSPAQWVAKFGSVTFNQFGREQPFGGMNEAGLVVEQMMLPETQYPAVDARPAVDLLQWIQYQLDTCATVAEVIATDARIRIAQPPVPARIHYLVCDASGDCATIELLDGRAVVHRGASLPVRVLANSPYAQSLQHAKAAPAGAAARSGPESLDRFACAAAQVAAFRAGDAGDGVDYAFAALDQVRIDGGTVWQLVYDLPARLIHVRTTGRPRTRVIAFAALDFETIVTPRHADLLSGSDTGEVTFTELTEDKLRSYLTGFYASESLRGALGDLTPSVEPVLRALRGYGPAGVVSSPASSGAASAAAK